MPLPFEFEGKGVFELLSSNKETCFFLGIEPTSVLDTISSPSPPTSSLGGGGGGGGGSADTAGVAAVSNVGIESGCGSSELRAVPPPQEVGGGGGSAVGMEDWESILSDSAAASPGQEQSVLRWIMGDVEDPSMGLNRLLQSGGGGGGGGAPPSVFDFHGGFGGGGVVDQGFGLDPVGSGGGNLMGPINSSLSIPGFPHTNNNNKFTHEKLNLPPNPHNPQNYKLPNNPPNPMFSPLSNNFLPISLSPAAFNHPQPQLESPETKPQIFNPLMVINNHHAQPPQNPSFFLPLPYPQQDPNLIFPLPAKRHNTGGIEPVQKGQFKLSDTMLQDNLVHQLHLPPYLHQRPKTDEMGQNQIIIDQLFNAAELIQAGNNSVHAHGILARLNHQLSPIGKPFHRAAFFFKEALQVLLHPPTSQHSSPFNLILKIGAYKSFSEISPLLQFANFTCNQALLEILDGFDRIHIVDFDIGYGGQWASLMQELALRGSGAPVLKITVVASPSTHDQLELGLTRENLIHFAGEINVPFEFEIISLDSLHSLPLHENEAVAVNLPITSFSNYQLPLHVILRFVKEISPKIVVSMDRGCDRTDLPFPNHVIHALQSYTNLLESLDAVNVNLEALQKIERFMIQPGIEKIVMGRYRSLEKISHWRTFFLSSGFSPLNFSNFAESQADCVVKRTPVRGFHVEKRQSSLVLCWQRKELISASAWRC